MEDELKKLLINQLNTMIKTSLTQEVMLESLNQNVDEKKFSQIKENIKYLIKTNQKTYSDFIEIIKEL